MASPFQSAYADLRQRLIANPGVALSTIFYDVFGSWAEFKRYAPEKHCPECAQQLFHSRLFDFPWLQRCPAHGIKLSDRCAVCGLRWPSSTGLQVRSCPGCGVPELDVLPQRTKLSDAQIARFDYVERFLQDRTSGFSFGPYPPTPHDLSYTYLWDSQLRYPWAWPVLDVSPEFPGFQIAVTAGYSQQELERLGVVFPDFRVERLSAPLRGLQLRPPSQLTWYERLKRKGPIRRPSEKARRGIEHCFNAIRTWCHRCQGTGHSLRLGDFRRFTFGSLVNKGYVLCPFCLAVSAWWDAITQKYFSPWQCSIPREYWWANTIGWSEWPDTPDRLLFIQPDHEGGDPNFYWRPAPTFEDRYYERSLLLLFAHLYQSAIHLMDRVEATPSPHRQRWNPENFYNIGGLASDLCLWRITEDRVLEWVWPVINPLSELSPPPSSAREHVCGNPTELAVSPGSTSLSYDLCTEADRMLSRDCILQIGSLFHSGRFETRHRRDSWMIRERPPCDFYPRFARW
jgi:hypothetical protein